MMRNTLIAVAKIWLKNARNIASFYYTAKVKFQCNSYQLPIKVNFSSRVSSSTILGCNVNFNGIEIMGKGNVKIGNNFHSGRNCLFITQIHNYDTGKAIPYDDTYIKKNITIKDNVWLGDRVIVAGNLTIGEGAIIQAGSVVVNDIPKYSIAGGHPAIAFKHRNIEHYEKLKKENKFC